MLDLYISSAIFCMLVPLLFVLAKSKIIFRARFPSNPSNIPKSCPIFASFFAFLKNKDGYVQWTSDIVLSMPNLTCPLHIHFGQPIIITANVANVKHILKSRFDNYEKGEVFKSTLRDLLGDGIINSDGEKWKFQRQVASHVFNAKSLRKFVEKVVNSELSNRLIPILRNAAANKTVVDFQDILQRFAFEVICMIAFGHDMGYLSPSLPQQKFALAFGKAEQLSRDRFSSFIPYFWKIKKALNIGSEKQLRKAVNEIRAFAKEIILDKKQGKSSRESVDDLLARFMSSGDEDFVVDIVINFILAGRDTTSAALTWFFWLLSHHPEVENEILREINEQSEAASSYDEMKDMVYTHASLCDSMRIYPPVPVEMKAALSDDVLPDGTIVKKGMRVSYNAYAMGRVENVWGKDWAAFRPSRWLEREAAAQKWSFVNRDSFTYPVFQAGPRTCLGKEMAFLQMKRVVAAVLRQFKVVPVVVEGAEPVYVAGLTAKMKDGFPVRIEERAEDGY